MPDDGPTLGELVRQLQSITTQLTDITTQLRTDFVRKDTYAEIKKAQDKEFRELNKDVQAMWDARRQDQSWKRQASMGVAIAVIGWLITIALFVITLATR